SFYSGVHNYPCLSCCFPDNVKCENLKFSEDEKSVREQNENDQRPDRNRRRSGAIQKRAYRAIQRVNKRETHVHDKAMVEVPRSTQAARHIYGQAADPSYQWSIALYPYRWRDLLQCGRHTQNV